MAQFDQGVKGNGLQFLNVDYDLGYAGKKEHCSYLWWELSHVLTMVLKNNCERHCINGAALNLCAGKN